MMNLVQNEVFSSEAIGLLILEELKFMRKELREEVKRIGRKLDSIIETRSPVMKGSSDCDEAHYENSLCIESVPEPDEGAMANGSEYEVQINCDSFENPMVGDNFDADDVTMVYQPDVSETENNYLLMPAENKLEKDYSCDSIQESIYSSNSLLDSKYSFHETPLLTVKKKKRTNGPSLYCKLCSSVFSSNYKLTRHLAEVHQHKTAYTCRYCSKVFYRESHLTRHVRIHTGEKPYKCEFCEKAFIRKDYLETHLKCHRDKLTSRQSCTICKRSFPDKYSLSEHLKTLCGGRGARRADKVTLLQKTPLKSSTRSAR
ncbi:uncharacterized protein LOC143461869 [Clavelina lepadiformis]|uniref:uncharacterized protein LOC143461869 n=1 Tax=Clavelina lepadiformis TaxID=159417 RepID=UPI004041D514